MSSKRSNSGSGKNSAASLLTGRKVSSASATKTAERFESEIVVTTTETVVVATANSPIVTASAASAIDAAAVRSGTMDAEVAGATCAATNVPSRTTNSHKGAVSKQTATAAKHYLKAVSSHNRGPVVVRRNPKRDARPDRYSHCELCAERDTSRMVQCDSCERWFHFCCVEVTDGIADVSWNCPLCPPKEQRNTPIESIKCNTPTKDSDSMKSRGKKSSKRSEQRKIELRLQKLEEQKQLEQRFLEEKYKILEELDSDTATDISEIELEKMSKISEWIRSTDRVGAVEDSGVVAEDLLEEPRVIPDRVTQSIAHDDPEVNQQQSVFEAYRQTLPSFVPEQRSTPQPSRPTFGHAREHSATMSRVPHPSRPLLTSALRPTQEPGLSPAEDTICLNRSQLAARQAVSKDLPEFDGNPEDWPLFFSMYSSSTQMCGFSNEENMLRLRKCLRGRALEAVRCRLLHPSNVSGVLATLKMLYGRPEAIVQAAIRKIRSLPPPDIDRLESLVNFALTVENLVSTIEACGVQDFVYNASLKYELIDRLPSTLKLDWAKYSRGNQAPNLLDFSSWLYSLAEDAAAVMQTTTNASRVKGNKKDAVLNVHSETDDDRNELPALTQESRSNRDVIKECFVCKGPCPYFAKCKRFIELSYESKWAAIREAKMCRKCLRKHNGSCRQQTECGINGCTYLHHPLLHAEKQEMTANISRQREATTNTSCNIHQAQTNGVLFRIVPVLLHGPSKTIQTYAFIDEGSELTLMENSLATELGLRGSQKALCGLVILEGWRTSLNK